MAGIDRKRLIGEVAARHGIRLDDDDPAFVLVTLAEGMLETARHEMETTIRHETAEFIRAAEQIQVSFGANLAVAQKRYTPSNNFAARNLSTIMAAAFGLLAGFGLAKLIPI